MPGLRDLKRRIKSVQSTRKITRAMQMVSAAKMRKAQAAALNSRTYSSLAWGLISELSPVLSRNENDEHDFPLLTTHKDAKKVGIVLLGTNRTLVGGLNTNLGKILDRQLRSVVQAPGLPQGKQAEGLHYGTEILSEVIVYGKQAKRVAQRSHYNITADFEKQEKTITSEEVYPLAKYITKAYISGEYRAIYVVYNHFVSTLNQQPTVKQLLPFIDSNNIVSLSKTGEGGGAVD